MARGEWEDEFDDDVEGYDDEDEGDFIEGYGDEIVGDEDDEFDEEGIEDELDEILSGYDDEDLEDELGRRRRRPRRRSRRRPRPRARSRSRFSRPRRRLKRVKNRQLRRYPLGLGATVIGSGATAIITANPQLPFQVNRLVIAINANSSGLLIDNLQVGTVSQFVAAGSVPIDIFAPDAVSVGLKGDTAVPGVNVQITVSNPTGGDLTFAGAIIGTVAQ